MKFITVAAACAATLLAAGSASAADWPIRIGDLDLSTAQGAAQFDRRVSRAARAACATGFGTLADLDCMARFREAAQDLLPSPRRADYARARAGRTVARTAITAQ